MFAPIKNRFVRRLALCILLLAFLLAQLYAAAQLVPLPGRLTLQDSQVVTWRDGRAAHVFLSEDDKRRIPVELERVEPNYVDALIALEDERFWDHPGVDPIAIGRAALSNIQHGDVVSGGSTITMQLVRLLEPRPRTLPSKMIEALRAMQLEMHMSKREILEAYLQFVPYGGNLEGIETASLAYFGHSANALSDAQIATLLAVPQNPSAFRPSARNEERLEKARDRIIGKLVRDDALDLGSGGHTRTAEEAIAQISSEPVPTQVRELPREIPHVAYWLRHRHDDLRVGTTLDQHLQERAEQMLRDREPEARMRGVHNASLVLADHEMGEIRALVGNFDFGDAEHGGQIAGFDIRRSTGSLMKPFLYAQAIDEGRMAPEHLEADVPVTFGAYSPENYEYRYSGLVRMEEALARSLNVPFVELLADVGVERFAEHLRRLGLHRLNPAPGEQGLSLAVGGVEATPIEVAELYAALVNDGQPTPLAFAEKNISTRRGRGQAAAFGEAAAWRTRQTLRRRDRPDFPARRHGIGQAPQIHWKTGTSGGNRDAWTAGSSPTYTAVVWMGNFDNSSSPHLIGSKAAAPVVFDLLEAVEHQRIGRDPRPDKSMTRLEVCAFSGHMPNHACEHTVEINVPTSAVPTERCPYHVEVDVDVETGLALPMTCRLSRESGRTVETQTFVDLPADVRRWMRTRLGDVSEPPRSHPACAAIETPSGPRISSPPANQTLVLMHGKPADSQKLPMEAQVDGADSLSWFVDGEFLGRATSGERLWWTPERGEHEVLVMTGDGQSARRTLMVR